MRDISSKDDSALRAAYTALVERAQNAEAEVERLKETIAEWQQIHGTFAPSGAPDDVHRACQTEIERLRTLEAWYTEAIDALHADVDRLQRENGALARTYTACEQMLRERTGQLNQVDAEIERLRAIADAAFAYVHTPVDDSEIGALYRALQVAVSETVLNASRAARASY